MFDSLLNTKFYNKCKHAFKCIRTRMGPIRRKKHTMIRFLKRDVADLLANGLDTRAFGRMDELIIELNHSSCYDMIEQFCDEIRKQLGSLQKQRECPPETREAASTLIFAAARFPDLPELRDLRHLFTERYGSFVEQFVSLEFVRNLESKEFTSEEKMQVMQSIADELSVSFDAKKLKLKLWATSETEYDILGKGSRKQVESAVPSSNKQKCDKDAPCERKEKDISEKVSRKPVELPMPLPNKQNCGKKYEAAPANCNEKVETKINSANSQVDPDGIVRFDENSRKHQSEKSDEKEHLEKPVCSGNTGRRKTQRVVKKVNRKDDRPSEKELMEAVELDLNGLPKHGIVAAKFPVTERNKVFQLNAKPKETVDEHLVEKENKEALRYCHQARMPGGPGHDGRRAESNLRANMNNYTEKQANNGFLNDRPQHLVDLGHPVQKEQGVTERSANRIPPYVKPKSDIQPVNGEPEKRTLKDYSEHKIPGQAEHLADKGVLRPVSVRRRNAKPPAPVDAGGEAPNKEKATSQTPGSHRSHSSRKHAAETDHNGNGTDVVVGNGKSVHKTPSSQPEHAGRRNGALNHDNDYDGFMLRRHPEEDATATDFGNNPLPRHATSAQRRHESGCIGYLLDEEERMMDKLLMHYSKKGSGPTNEAANDNETQTDSRQKPKVSLQPRPGRAISFPVQPVGPAGEDVKVPAARSTSLHPDCPRAVRVHPRVPDFDELAARVNALRNA